MTSVWAKAQVSILNNKEAEPIIQDALFHIYNFEFDQAQISIKELKTKIHHHPAVYFLESMCIYWEMVPVTAAHPKFGQYEKLLEKTLLQSEEYLKYPKTKLEATFFKLASHTSLAVAHVKAGDYGQSLLEVRKTYSNMKFAFAHVKNLSEFYFTSGLYFFYAEQYPETHPYYQPFMWFFEKGNKQLGIEYLKKGAEVATFTSTECNYFIAHIYLKYYNRPDLALIYTTKLIEQYPNNLFYLARHIEALTFLNKHDEALKHIVKLQMGKKELYQFLVETFKGEIYYQKGQLDESTKHFNNAYFLAQKLKRQTSDYLAFVYMGYAKIYFEQKNKKLFNYYLDKLEEKGEYLIHKQVLKALKNKKIE